MSKAEGKIINIKFSLPLVGDVSGNEGAFTITGQEPLYTDGPDNNGPLSIKTLPVSLVQRYPPPVLVNDIFEGAKVLSNAYVEGYGPNLCPGKTYAASGSYSGFPSPNPYNQTGMWYAANAGVPQWTSIDYGVGNAKKIRKLGLTNGVAERLSTFIFQGSNDNTNWTNLYNGTQLSNTVMQIHEFENNNYYRYYRVYITGQLAYARVALTAITQQEYTQVASGYIPTETFTSDPITIDGEVRLQWLETKPTDTNIQMQYTTGLEQGIWVDVNKNDVIFVDTNLWLRAILSTNNTVVTPTLNNVWLEQSEISPDIIQLTFTAATSFRNIIGPVTITYNQGLGNLMGIGGPVVSFSSLFTPDELTQQPKGVSSREYIQASIGGSFTITEIVKINGYSPNEYITATIDGLITTTHIDDINP